MSYRDALRDEIAAEIEFLRERRRPILPDWITQNVCSRHQAALESAESEEDAAFWRFTGYAFTRDLVRRVINETMGPNSGGDAKQRVLPGFEHLQEYYLVKREGDQVGVPIEEMTDAEIDAKMEEHDKMGSAHFAHRDELATYKEQRRVQCAG